jgi:hypothetical protein
MLLATLALSVLAGDHPSLQPALEPFPLDPAATYTPLLQGRVLETHRPYFISVGYHLMQGEVRHASGATPSDPEDEMGFSLDLGVISWREDFGMGIEVGAMMSSYEIGNGSLFAPTTDDVDVVRYLAGLRMFDARYSALWHGRVGVVYREDDGDSKATSDDGTGWYAGGGVEWRLGRFSIGPQVLYMKTDSLNSSEWIFGLNGTFGF